MAVRKIIFEGDEVLRKKSREVEIITDKVKVLLDDMAQTMYKNDGCGLAAPQVGILKRIVVIDVGEGLIELINPVITHSEGNVCDMEGCLSVPGKSGKVCRPAKVSVKALDRDGNEISFDAEELLARCVCHELDHLDGILYIDKVVE